MLFGVITAGTSLRRFAVVRGHWPRDCAAWSAERDGCATASPANKPPAAIEVRIVMLRFMDISFGSVRCVAGSNHSNPVHLPPLIRKRGLEVTASGRRHKIAAAVSRCQTALTAELRWVPVIRQDCVRSA